MTEKILVKVSTDDEIREEFIECFGDRAEIVFCDSEISEKDLKSATVIVGEPDENELKLAENLRLLQLTWAGADKFLKMKNFPKSIKLTTASGAFGEVISEYVIGGILALYRDFQLYIKNQQNHIWQKRETVETITGKTVLILGTGDIGRTTAKKLRALGVKEIFGVRRKSKEDFLEYFDEIFDIIELDFLLPRADIVICCLPETKSTIGVLNEEMLSLMKVNSVLVNVGRGSLIVTSDLIKILKHNKIKGAVLDVFETEPVPQSSELWDMENVIITPHIAGPSFRGDEATKDKIWKICFENIESYLCGGTLKNVVDFDRGY